MVGVQAWVQRPAVVDCCGGWHGASVIVSGVVLCPGRDDRRVVSATACYGGEIDDQLA